MGIAILLGGAVKEIRESSSPRSSSSGKSQDPDVGSGGGVVFNVALPLGGAVLKTLISPTLPRGWTCMTSWSAGARLAMRKWRCDLCGDDDGCKMSRVVACLRRRPFGMLLSVKSELRRCGATLRQRCHVMGRSDSVGARCAPFLLRGLSLKSELPGPRRLRPIVCLWPARFSCTVHSEGS